MAVYNATATYDDPAVTYAGGGGGGSNVYDTTLCTYDDPECTYDGLVVGATTAGRDPAVFVRFPSSSPKRLALVRSAIGMLSGFGPDEGWEIVSKRFLMLPGTHDATMANIRTVWLANRDDTTSALKAALDAELAADGYTFTDGPAPAATS